MGWEPKVYSYDAEGNLLGWTQAEPEWDDDQRNRMLALMEYEAGVHSCGFHRSLAFDMSNGFTFEFETCPVCAGRDRFERVVSERDKREREAAGDSNGVLSMDGRTIRTRMLTEAEHAERKATAELPAPERRRRLAAVKPAG